MIDERASHSAIRPSPAGAAIAAIASGAVPAAMVRELQRERDHLLMLQEALAQVDQAEGVPARLRVFADSIARIGFGRVIITLRDAALNVRDIVSAGLTPEEERQLRETASPGDVWRRRLHAIERFRVSESFYLPGHDPVVMAEFGERLPSCIADTSGDGWSPSDMLLVPMRDPDGTIVGLLLLDDPDDRSRPTLTRIRTVELFAQQVVAMLRQAELRELAQQRAERLQTLHEVGSLLARSLDERAILATMSEQLGRVLDGRVVLHAPTGDATAGDALVSRAMHGGRPARNEHGTRIVVPASLAGSAQLVIDVTRDGEGSPFDADEEELLLTIAAQAAAAVGNARLFQEAERHRLVVETTSDAIVITDRDRRIAFANPAARALFGFGEGLIGLPVSQTSTPEMRDHVREHEDLAFEGVPQRYESVVVRADGDHRNVAITTAPLRDAGTVGGVVASLRDVTEERARESALARAEARYTRLVEFASDAIFTLDAKGAFTAVNRSLEKGIGRTRDELIGHPFSDFIDSRDLVSAKQVHADTLEGMRMRCVLRYRAANGDVRDGSLITSPVLEGKEIVGVLGIMRDVTDERRLAAQLLQQEKLAAVGQLVSGVAHELNNPLAGVMAFAELLLTQEFPDEETTRAIDTIHREAQRAAKIVRHLLTFARQHPSEQVVTDLNAVVHDSVQLRRYAMKTGEIELDVSLDPDLPLTWADPFQLQQVVLNLIGNAEHALTEVNGDRRITVRTSHRDGVITLAVGDTGPGISGERVDRIFNPFYTTKPVGQGTGLGLSISDGIVREHGGRIRVESEEGRGAVFFVELPVVAPPVAAGRTSSEREPRPAAAGRLLVVDDESAMRSAMSSFLQAEGHAVDAAGSTAEARALMLANEYDVVLLDLRMPADPGGDRVKGGGEGGGGGGRLYEDMLARDPRHAARVVFVTGDLESEDTQRFLAAAGRPVVGKPFQLDELATVVAGTMH